LGYDLVEAEIKSGEHLCSFYENKMEQFQIVIPFLVQGLARNEKCLYIADENTIEEVKAGLVMYGVDVEERLRSGQLNILTAAESYLRPGKFMLDDMILQLDSFVDDAERGLHWCTGIGRTDMADTQPEQSRRVFRIRKDR
jgi:hypothetical protein